MIYILTACMIMLVIAAILVTIRTVRGPTSLDRMVSVDMVSSILIGAVALLAALTKRSDLLALFIVLALIGFVGSHHRVAGQSPSRRQNLHSSLKSPRHRGCTHPCHAQERPRQYAPTSVSQVRVLLANPQFAAPRDRAA